jgi:membrane associated rhomboid family serine protease
LQKDLKDLLDRIALPAAFVLLLWVIHLMKSFSNQVWEWTSFGVYPQELDGIKGIVFAPLIHGDWLHLASNSLPFFITGSMMMLFYPSVAPRALVMLCFLVALVFIISEQVAWSMAWYLFCFGVVFLGAVLAPFS